MKTPPYLKPGDTIAITCPSGYLPEDKIFDSIDHFKKWGLNVIVGKTVGSKSQNYFSAPDAERLEELQDFLDNRSINAIMMGRGGYGLSRIIDELQFDKFIQHPKWICGFSDITLLHTHINRNCKIVTLHSSMCGAFQPKENWDPTPVIESIYQSLFGYPNMNIQVETCEKNHLGVASGALIGGNLAMIAHSIGSKSEPRTNGKILFLEDIGEHLYKIDRMMIQLKRAGLFDNLSGMIFGQFSDTEDTTRPFGTDLINLLDNHLKKYTFPIAYQFPIGHEDYNLSVKIGQEYTLEVGDKYTLLKEL